MQFTFDIADGAIFDRSFDFIDALPPGYWILGDSAFAIRPGRVERRRKKNELLPSDPVRERFQLDLEAFSGKVRLSGEWGIKDIKRSWLVMYCALPSDDSSFRICVWQSVMFLHNLRTRIMRVGQIGSVWALDTHSSQ